MSLQHLIEVLQALPADVQGKARDGERLLDLRRNAEGLSLRLTISLSDNNGSEPIFDALLQCPAQPGSKAVQLQSLSPGNSFNKRAQRCMEPMMTWAIQLLSETPEQIRRGTGRKPQWLEPLQKLVTALSRDAGWTRQWLLRNEMQLKDLRKSSAWTGCCVSWQTKAISPESTGRMTSLSLTALPICWKNTIRNSMPKRHGMNSMMPKQPLRR